MEVKTIAAKYVCYYDCTDWNSSVEIMNINDLRATYVLSLYRRNGSHITTHSATLYPHQTDRVEIDRLTEKNEGLVVVADRRNELEFPSLLTICDEGRHFKEGNRFVPFIRVP
jgi:hypothetical protein